MKQLIIGDLVAPMPVIQGGMGVGISLSGLASAVANEGGIGIISAAGLGMIYRHLPGDFLENSKEGLRIEIRKARQMTQGIIGVNLMVALSNYDELVRVSLEEGVDLIISGAGLPLDLPKHLVQGSKTRLVPIVSSARAASLICNKWQSHFNYLPDAIVVEGPMAGGHLGFKLEQIFDENFRLERLVPEVIAAVAPFAAKYGKDIPVIAAGGIYYGSDMARFFELGASGVQMGTRFVTTTECDASDEFKQAYLNAGKSDIRIIRSPVGMPGRAISSPFLDEVEAGRRQPKTCPVNCVRTCDILTAPYCIMAALTAARKGKFNRGYAFAGSNVWRNDEIITVKELMNKLRAEFSNTLLDTGNGQENTGDFILAKAV